MILASKSPRRKEILEKLGMELDIKVSDVDEYSEKEGLIEKIEDISYKKCVAVAEKNTEEYVLAADTVVVIDDVILGKPEGEDDAKEMLRSLSGRQHQVVTAYTLLNVKKGFLLKDHDTTQVYFKELDADEIDWYISTGEPFDKAGAYGIQGKGSIFVERIEGDFFNVMGFPVSKFYEGLKKNGFDMSRIKKL